MKMPDYKRLVKRKIPARKVKTLDSDAKLTIAKIFAIVILLGVVVYSCMGTRSFLLAFSGFNIDSVCVVDENGRTLEDGHEIFDIGRLEEDAHLITFDLNKVVEDIRTRHPELSSVVVRRDFPSTLTIIAQKRIPFAIIGDGARLVDNNGFAMPFDSEYVDLPVIVGVNARHVPINAKSHSLRLEKALALLRALEKTRIYPEHMISQVDVTDYANIVFYLDERIEVKMGGDDFSQKVAALKGILAQLKNDKDLSPQYIDMRFDDPAVLPQN
jgi:cell division septal protein FtsQ